MFNKAENYVMFFEDFSFLAAFIYEYKTICRGVKHLNVCSTGTCEATSMFTRTHTNKVMFDKLSV